MTVIYKPIAQSSVDPTKLVEERWQRENLAQMWRKFTGKELPQQTIDETPDKGSGWMK